MAETTNHRRRISLKWAAVLSLLSPVLHAPARANCDSLGLRTFSLSADSPTLTDVMIGGRPGSAADLFTPDPANPAGPPRLVASAESLGLVAGDDIDGVSFGLEWTYVGDVLDYPVCFSVDRDAVGVAPWDVNTEAGNPAYPEASPDVFETDFFFASGGAAGFFNFLTDDGDGSSGSPLNLIDNPVYDNPAFPPNDDLDALEGNPRRLDWDGDGVRNRAVYFSLRAGSPSLAALGASPGDILVSAPPPDIAPKVFLSAAAIGLGAGEDMDDFCLTAADGRVNFSLPPGAPSLAALGAGPGAVLKNAPLGVVWSADKLALLEGATGDNMNALDCFDDDTDVDGVRDLLDCAPVNDQVWAIPGEATGLRWSGATLGWSAPAASGGTPTSLFYDALRSSTASSFTVGTICLASNTPGRTATDIDPPAGARFYYVVGAQNECGRGSLGASSRGVERTGISCP